MVRWVFWVSLFLVAYPYVVYPALLTAVNRLRGKRPAAAVGDLQPSVTVLLPVHNEARRIVAKADNLLQLDYPVQRLQLIVIGDGCTDDSLRKAAEAGMGRIETVALPERAGKAAALNAGLDRARGDIVVFTDAAILLERGSLKALVSRFQDSDVGCISGEDLVEGGNESLYGRLELLLRREEAHLHSIAGASGCFYAQRRQLCRPFLAGMAPDFLSVLVTVAAGRRALAEPAARGYMTATSSQHNEFQRKVRTFLRGITALSGNARLLNPLRFPAFSFILWSHKVMRWLAPVFMIGALASGWLARDSFPCALLLVAQLAAYALAVAALMWEPVAQRIMPARLAGFFLLVNVAALLALAQWVSGRRIEVWQPTARPG